MAEGERGIWGSVEGALHAIRSPQSVNRGDDADVQQPILQSNGRQVDSVSYPLSNCSICIVLYSSGRYPKKILANFFVCPRRMPDALIRCTDKCDRYRLCRPVRIQGKMGHTLELWNGCCVDWNVRTSRLIWMWRISSSSTRVSFWQEKHWTRLLVATTASIALATVLPAGYHIGNLNGPQKVMIAWLQINTCLVTSALKFLATVWILRHKTWLLTLRALSKYSCEEGTRNMWH